MCRYVIYFRGGRQRPMTRLTVTAVAIASSCALIAGCGRQELRSVDTPIMAGQFTQPTSQPELTTAVRELAGQLGPDFAVRSSEHFVFLAADAGWCDIAGQRLERLYARFYGSIKQAGLGGAPPAERLVWICFKTREEFDCYVASVERMNLSWLEGYYSARSNRVAVVRPAPHAGPASAPDAEADSQAEVMHEACHQLSFNCGLLKRGVMYPLWVTEGMATNYELGAPGDEASNPIRCPHLRESLNRADLPTLDGLVTQTRVPGSGGQAVRAYAQAWAMFRFVFQTRPAELKRYLAALAALPAGRRTHRRHPPGVRRRLRADRKASAGVGPIPG